MAFVRCLLTLAALLGTEANENATSVVFHPFGFDMPTSTDVDGFIAANPLPITMGNSSDSKPKHMPSFGSRVSDVPRRRRSTWSCAGARRRTYPTAFHAFKMFFDTERESVANRNAADMKGIMSLIHGGGGAKGQVSDAWGLKRYYNDKGRIMIVYVSVTSFGEYESCNAEHPSVPNSPHSCHVCTKSKDDCCCSAPPLPVNATSAPKAGRLQATYTGGGYWYSFNKDGEDVTWHQHECPNHSGTMTHFIEKLAQTAGCSAHASTDQLAMCLRKMETHGIELVFNEFFQMDSLKMTEQEDHGVMV